MSNATKEMASKVTNKYTYERIIQCNTSYGWEDVSRYDKPRTPEERQIIEHDLKEYRASNTGAYRLISRRTLNA